MTAKPSMAPLPKFVLEMGPLLLYFIAYFKGDWLIGNISLFSSFQDPIFPATAIFMVAAMAALIISVVTMRQIPIMPLVSGIVIVIFGGLSLWFQNDIFAKLKPTIINALFALVLFGGLYFKKSLLSFVLGPAFQLDEMGWRKLTQRWAWFFIVLALLNEFVWRSFGTDTWMTYRTFGPMALSFLFIIIQMPLIMRHTLEQFPKSGNRFSDKNCSKTQELEQLTAAEAKGKTALNKQT